MMERTIEEMMGRKVTDGEHVKMRAIFDETPKLPQMTPRNKVKAKAARKSRKRNR